MIEQKPPEITDEEWANTPPTVRALLTQAMAEVKPSAEPAGAADGGTVRMAAAGSMDNVAATTTAMPTLEPDVEDGATTHMPPAQSPESGEGATVNMPRPQTGDEAGATYISAGTAATTPEEGATMAMPGPAGQPDTSDPEIWFEEEEGGATMAMPPGRVPAADDASPLPADDGGTVAMPAAAGMEAEAGTMRMPPPDFEADEGSTRAMSGDDVTFEDGATTAMPMPSPDEADDGGTTAMTGDDLSDGATTAMPLSTGGPEEHDWVDDGGTRAMADARATDVSPSSPTVVAPDPAKTQPQTRATQPEEDIAAKNIILQNRYRLQKILGKGGFGAAYLAEDIKLRRGCVVKQMLSPKGISARELAQNQENFEREARLLVELNHPGHPNIPEIFDYFSDESGSYLVMKYIEGQSLESILKAGEAGRIAWREAVRYTIDVCSALNYMHTQGDEPVMHRDIKPANILLGDDGRIWLVDFGLARSKPVEDTDDLSAGDAAGSVGYTPFEQWIGEAVPASDIYATGVTLHHMVTGLSPLEAYRESGRLQVNIQKMQEMHGQLESIRKIDRKLPKELDEIVERAVAAEPDQRLTALQLEQQLEVLVSGAKDAALFTFKNGQSAKTIPQLVDLCEQNRVEAQGYLYRGDFERWFTLINRNDLAAAAAKAVKQEGKGKDGLERFLKLIMPNLFWRRLGRAGFRVARVGAQLLIILLLALLIVVIVGTFAGRWLLQRGIANANWDYYALELDQDNIFTEDYLTAGAEDTTRLFLEFVQVDTLSPDQVILNGNVGGFLWLRVPADIRLEENRPQVSLTEINGLPLYWVGDNLTAGINSGINQALTRAPIKITDMDVQDNAVILRVGKSDTVAYTPPTPSIESEPTATPTPLPTPTPPGLALLAVFNELPRPVILEIQGDRWTIEANDNKVIEKPPGTYDYTLLYAENGQLAAQGEKSWDYRAYRWRITEQGDILE